MFSIFHFVFQILHSKPYFLREEKVFLYPSKERCLGWVMFEVQYVCCLDKVRSQLRVMWSMHNNRTFTIGGDTIEHNGNEILIGDLWIAKIWSIGISATLCYASTIKIMLDLCTLSEKINPELSFVSRYVWVSVLLFYPSKKIKRLIIMLQELADFTGWAVVSCLVPKRPDGKPGPGNIQPVFGVWSLIQSLRSSQNTTSWIGCSFALRIGWDLVLEKIKKRLEKKGRGRVMWESWDGSESPQYFIVYSICWIIFIFGKMLSRSLTCNWGC